MATAKCPSEHDEQCAFVQWWRRTQPDDLFAIPNGGSRSKSQAGKLKAEGVMAGVADLYAPSRRLWIEFKRVCAGTLSQEQKDFLARRLRDGDRAMVAWGCEDAIHQVTHGERASHARPKK